MQWQRYKDSKKINRWNVIFKNRDKKQSKTIQLCQTAHVETHWKMSTWKSLFKSNQNTKFINKLNRFFLESKLQFHQRTMRIFTKNSWLNGCFPASLIVAPTLFTIERRTYVGLRRSFGPAGVDSDPSRRPRYSRSSNGCRQMF